MTTLYTFGRTTPIIKCDDEYNTFTKYVNCATCYGKFSLTIMSIHNVSYNKYPEIFHSILSETINLLQHITDVRFSNDKLYIALHIYIQLEISIQSLYSLLKVKRFRVYTYSNTNVPICEKCYLRIWILHV